MFNMKSNFNKSNENKSQSYEPVIESENNSTIADIQTPDDTLKEVSDETSAKKRRNSTKSIKGLSKNKIFPQKLPPLKRNKNKIMKKINKVQQERKNGMSTDGFEVVWRNLSYMVKNSSFRINFCKKSVPSYRIVLKCLSGSFKSAQLTAVMGPSGAGKSTLLACVCGKRTEGVSGDISIKGSNLMKVSIITQNDYLTDKFTLREALLFASKAKNGKHEDHEHIILNVVNSLGLEGCLNTRLAKCSGGQRRKISIALELVSSPNIMILDEPTSGLDSAACYQIIENLRELTQQKRNPMAIVATIHQPSARVFNLFHNIYVISYNGQAIYHGPPNALVDYLSHVNLSVPEYHNPADYIAEIASGEYGEDSITQLASIRKESLTKMEAIEAPKPSLSRKLAKMSKTNRYPHFYHLFILIKRSIVLIAREPHLSTIRLISSLLISIFMAQIFGHSVGQVSGCQPRKEVLYSSKPTDLYKNFEFEHKSIQENLGSFFFNCIFLLYSGLMPMIMVFPKEFNVVKKQYTNGWYSTFTYFVSKVLSDIPITLMATSIYIGIWYTMSDQIWEIWRFSVTMAISVLIVLIGQSQGLICSAIFSENPVSAGYLGVTSTIPMFLMSGFFVRTKRIPHYLLPVTALSYTKYAFESTVITLYGYDRCWYPTTNETLPPPPWLKFMTAITATMIDNKDNDDDLNDYNSESKEQSDQALNDILALFSGTTTAANSKYGKYQSMVMSQFEFTDEQLPWNCLVLGMYCLIFQVFAYLILIWKLKKTH